MEYDQECKDMLAFKEEEGFTIKDLAEVFGCSEVKCLDMLLHAQNLNAKERLSK
jgi:cyanate lyase